MFVFGGTSKKQATWEIEETNLAVLCFCWHRQLAYTGSSEQASRDGREKSCLFCNIKFRKYKSNAVQTMMDFESSFHYLTRLESMEIYG